MKSEATKKTAAEIGDASFALLNFDQLPARCSKVEQVRALKTDQEWQADHHNEISRRIDYLIADIKHGNRAA